MDTSDPTTSGGSNKPPRPPVRIGRATIIAMGIAWAGSMTYAAVAFRSGEVSHSIRSENPSTRLTSVGFTSWRGIVPAPEIAEYTYQEIQLPGGEWVKHGRYGRRTREGFAHEEGSYDEGRRDGRWVFWNLDGSIDVERSGVYSEDVRVKPGPASPTDLDWALGTNRP